MYMEKFPKNSLEKKTGYDEFSIDSIIGDIQKNDDLIKLKEAFAEMGNIVNFMKDLKTLTQRISAVITDETASKESRIQAKANLDFIKQALQSLKQTAMNETTAIFNNDFKNFKSNLNHLSSDYRA